jgi:hypothetical protein
MLRDTIQTFKKAAEHFQKGNELLGGGPLGFYLEEMAGFCEYAIAHFAPWHIGDTVIWIYKPKEDEWRGCQTVRRKDAKCVIKSVECTGKGFLFSVKFDDDEHTFSCNENMLKDLPSEDPKELLEELATFVDMYWKAEVVPNFDRPLAIARKYRKERV